MKKVVILLMALGLFTTYCNNNKSGKNPDTKTRDKDDYGKSSNREADNNNLNKDDLSKNNDRTGQMGNWSGSDIKSFNEECLKTVKYNEEVAKTFCPCLLEKFQNKYSSLAEMDKYATEEEGRTAAEKCMTLIKGNNENNVDNNISGGWPQVERDGFTTNCIKNAMAKGVSRTVAQDYCACMLNKMENLYPDIQDAGRLTKEDLESPAMKKMVSDCLNNN